MSLAIWLLKLSILTEVMRCLKKAVIADRSRSKPRSDFFPDSSTSAHHRLMRTATERALVTTA
jgi:hypothetical protein